MNTILTERVLSTGQTLQIAQGDITIDEVDAIVNAANEHLQHGGGVAWSIVRRGGDVIQEESDAWIQKHGLVSHSRPAWTSGGALPAKYVIHAVGPVWGDGDEDKKLADAVYGSLRVADELKLTSISMPAISTGIFGFPKDRAAKIILKTIQKYFDKQKSGLKIVRILLFDQATVDVFIKEWKTENGG
jgi:O-acetyl-ADP-ribose deacetylase (regulator of RNase III)